MASIDFHILNVLSDLDKTNQKLKFGYIQALYEISSI